MDDKALVGRVAEGDATPSEVRECQERYVRSEDFRLLVKGQQYAGLVVRSPEQLGRVDRLELMATNQHWSFGRYDSPRKS